MPDKPYKFSTQNRVGQSGEAYLDQWLQHTYKIVDVSLDPKYQRSGIDRILTKPDGSTITVEYKVDAAAKRTGNIFLRQFQMMCETFLDGAGLLRLTTSFS